MIESKQPEEIDIVDIASTRNAIFLIKKEITGEIENDRQTGNQLVEIRNWLRGHEFDDETLRARGLLHTAREKKDELESLQRKSAESKGRLAKLRLNLQELEAIEFSADQTMNLAMADYRESLAYVNELQQQEASLSKEKEVATGALNNAVSLLNLAQAAKKKSLSLSEVSKASEDELNAKRQVDELESLVKNLDEALRPIPAKISAKQSDLKNAETNVWNAKLTQLLLSVQENPEFNPVFTLIEMAFGAWIKAGKTHSTGHFLDAVFVASKLLRIDHDSVTALQSAMAKEMGLADCLEPHQKERMRRLYPDTFAPD